MRIYVYDPETYLFLHLGRHLALTFQSELPSMSRRRVSVDVVWADRPSLTQLLTPPRGTLLEVLE